jgi:hypothetical protein
VAAAVELGNSSSSSASGGAMAMARWHSSGTVSSQAEAATWPVDGEHWAAQAMDGRGDRRGRAALHGATRSGQRSSSSGRAARPAMAAGG